LDEYLDIL
jgi:hypothetical protein